MGVFVWWVKVGSGDFKSGCGKYMGYLWGGGLMWKI